MAASRFAEVSDEEICEIKINAVPKSMQNATKYGVKLFKGKPAFCFELNYFNSKVSVNQQKYRFNTEQPRKYSSSNLFQTEWFAQQKEFKTEFESMEVEEMNNCLSKFYLSARRKDGSYYKKTSLLSIRAALDRYLRSPPFNKKVSICDTVQFNEANKALNSYLKHLASSGKIAGTVHKNSLTTETVQKLFEAGQLASAETRNPRLLLQTTWFYISLYFGKRGRENQSAMKKSMLRLAVTPSGEEYFELNKDEPGAVLSTKNHRGGLDGTEDHADGKIFASPNSSRCPLQTIKAYFCHLHPEVDALFQRPKDISLRFAQEKIRSGLRRRSWAITPWKT